MSSDRRDQIADHLYLKRGAIDASHRCDVNVRLGNFDLSQAVADVLCLRPGHTLVDVGCGSGHHLAALARSLGERGRAKGFDISKEAIASARELGLEAEVADAARLPVESETVDALTCMFAIYYHPDLPAVVAEFRRVLRTYGRVLVAGPARVTNQELYDFHFRATGAHPSDADQIALGYVETDVYRALETAGFEDIKCTLHTNRIEFPSSSEFLAYWRATSLFARTPNARFEDGVALLAGRASPISLTKRVALLTAVRH
jgi:ubiquinone/menaquinone biosynthesis C-methylase UbiE